MKSTGTLIYCLLGAALAFPAETARCLLTVQVRPEADLRLQAPGTVSVKIRLAKGTQAHFAVQPACQAPPPDAQSITRSGTYVFPIQNPTGHACLYTHTQTLSLPLQSEKQGRDTHSPFFSRAAGCRKLGNEYPVPVFI